MRVGTPRKAGEGSKCSSVLTPRTCRRPCALTHGRELLGGIQGGDVGVWVSNPLTNIVIIIIIVVIKIIIIIITTIIIIGAVLIVIIIMPQNPKALNPRPPKLKESNSSLGARRITYP